MSRQQEIATVFASLKTKALAAGAQVELTLSEGEKFAATYQDRKLKKYSSDQTASAVIRVLKGSGVGLATTENLAPDSLEQCFNEALQSARDLDQGVSDVQLAEDLVAPASSYPEVKLFTSDYEDVPIAERLKWAETLEKVALDADPRVTNVPYSGVTLSSGRTWLLNSKGLDRSYQSSGISGYSYSLAKEGEKSKGGHQSFFQRTPQNLPLGEVAREGASKALEMLSAVQPKTGQFPAVLTNDVASQLLSVLGHHLSAKAIDENTSLFKDKKGQALLSKELTILDNPLDEKLPGSRPFDSEGTPSQKTPLFKNGVLESILTNSYYARKLKLPSTGNAVRGRAGLDISPSNMQVTPGTKTFDELVNMAPEVIVITEESGFHSGMKEMTGDFSLPASGFMYRNGKKAEALEQFVISGNLFDLLKSVTATSNRLNENGSSIQTPDLFVPALSIAGSQGDAK